MKKILTAILITSILTLVGCSTQNQNNDLRATGADDATATSGGTQGGTAETNDF